MAADGVAARNVPTNAVVMLRRSLIRDYARAGLAPVNADAFNYSMWRSYLGRLCHAEPLEWCKAAGAEIAYLHTSGHAAPKDLRAFAAAVAPKTQVPVHGENWDTKADGFGAIRRLRDGEAWTLP